MPQVTVIPDWKATYVNDAPVQKPSGITVSTTLGTHAVPNKPTYSAGTIQMYETEEGEIKLLTSQGTEPLATNLGETPTREASIRTQEDAEEHNMEEIEDEDGDGDDGPSRTVKRTTTRTTTRKR